MNGEPEWVAIFLGYLRRRIDVRRAAQLSGRTRTQVYRFRHSKNGARLLAEWERIRPIRQVHRPQ